MSSLQRRFGLPTDLTPSVCHSVLLIVHLLSFIRAMCPAHFHFVLVTYWTKPVTLVLCLMMVLRILSLSLALRMFLSATDYPKHTLNGEGSSSSLAKALATASSTRTTTSVFITPSGLTFQVTFTADDSRGVEEVYRHKSTPTVNVVN